MRSTVVIYVVAALDVLALLGGKPSLVILISLVGLGVFWVTERIADAREMHAPLAASAASPTRVLQPTGR